MSSIVNGWVLQPVNRNSCFQNLSWRQCYLFFVFPSVWWWQTVFSSLTWHFSEPRGQRVQSSVLLQALWHFISSHTNFPTETMALLYTAIFLFFYFLFLTRNTNVASTWPDGLSLSSEPKLQFGTVEKGMMVRTSWNDWSKITMTSVYHGC